MFDYHNLNSRQNIMFWSLSWNFRLVQVTKYVLWNYQIICFWWHFWLLFPSKVLSLEKHQSSSQWGSLKIWRPYMFRIATVTHKYIMKKYSKSSGVWTDVLLYCNQSPSRAAEKCFLRFSPYWQGQRFWNLQVCPSSSCLRGL